MYILSRGLLSSLILIKDQRLKNVGCIEIQLTLVRSSKTMKVHETT